jgi:ATP-dependent DNA ligase
MKAMRTADCVVGGYRYASKGRLVGSLLLGLYDDGGLLHHVGFTSTMRASEKSELTTRLEKLKRAPGFTGQTPGGPSRWSTERTGDWEPLAPTLVVEVQYDHFSGGRFRHGTTFLRWRPDKSPSQCTVAQVEQEGRSALGLVKRTTKVKPKVKTKTKVTTKVTTKVKAKAKAKVTTKVKRKPTTTRTTTRHRG